MKKNEYPEILSRYFFFFIVSSILFGIKSFACPGERTITYVNPDGSFGGKVSKLASIAGEVYIDKNAMVCGRSRIDRKVQILDRAIVRENAWIGSYSVLKGTIMVSGSSQTRGTLGRPVLISGRAKVSGNSKILEGSSVSGDAIIYGGISLISSSVEGKSIVCDSSVVRDEEIIDSNYFCSDYVPESRSEVIMNQGKYEFYELDKDFNLKLSKDKFSSDYNSTSIRINGSQLLDGYELSREAIRVFDTSKVLEGLNSIYLVSRDSYGKAVSAIMDVYFGNVDYEIQVNGDVKRIEASVFDGTQTINLPIKLLNGRVLISNIPESFSELMMEVKIITSSGLYYYSGNLGSMESAIQFMPFPVSANSANLDFHDGAIGWSLSHPTSTEITFEQNKANISIDSSANGNVFFISRLKNITNAGVSLKFSENESYPSKRSLKYFLLNLTTGQFKTKEDFLSDSVIPLPVGDTEYILILTYSNIATTNKKSSGFGAQSVSTPYLLSIELFNPFFFNYKQHNIAVDAIDIQGDENDCGGIFQVDETAIQIENGINQAKNIHTHYARKKSDGTLFPPYESIKEPLNYISVGFSPFYQTTIMNRLYASISLQDIKTSDVDWLNSYLQIENPLTHEKFPAPLNRCILSDVIDNSDSFSLFREIISPQKNLVKFPFYISAATMNAIDLSLINSNINYVNTKLILKKRNSMEVFSSIETRYPVLKSLRFGINSYNPEDAFLRFGYGGVDAFSNFAEEYVLTSGDKWGQPHTIGIIERMINRLKSHSQNFVNWFVNDASRLNGGSFPKHKDHESGLDFDVRYLQFIPILNLKNPDIDSLKLIISNIFSFLSVNSPDLKFIDKIFLTADSQHYFFRNYQNSCFLGRLIDLTLAGSGRALITNSVTHDDHLHLRFKSLEDSLLAHPPRPPELTLADFNFGFDKDNRFFVKPSASAKDREIEFHWRLQDVYENDLVTYLDWGVNQKFMGGVGNPASDKRFLKISAVGPDGSCNGQYYYFVFEMDKLCRKDDSKVQDFRIHPSGFGKVSLNADVSDAVIVDQNSYICDTISLGGTAQVLDSKISGSANLFGSSDSGIVFNKVKAKITGSALGRFTYSNTDPANVDSNFMIADLNVIGNIEIRNSKILIPEGKSLFLRNSAGQGGSIYDSTILSAFSSVSSLNLGNSQVNGDVTLVGNNINISGMILEDFNILGTGYTSIQSIAPKSLKRVFINNNSTYSAEYNSLNFFNVEGEDFTVNLSGDSNIKLSNTIISNDSTLSANDGTITVGCKTISNENIFSPYFYTGPNCITGHGK